jgi:hypothetical protein
LIKDGGVEEYRQAVYELRPKRRNSLEARKWNDPISFQGDGTVMALSVLPIRKRRTL